MIFSVNFRIHTAAKEDTYLSIFNNYITTVSLHTATTLVRYLRCDTRRWWGIHYHTVNTHKANINHDYSANKDITTKIDITVTRDIAINKDITAEENTCRRNVTRINCITTASLHTAIMLVKYVCTLRYISGDMGQI